MKFSLMLNTRLHSRTEREKTHQPRDGRWQPVDPLDDARLDLVDQTARAERERGSDMKERVSESTWVVGSSGQTSEGTDQKVLQRPSVVCLRRCLMAATWFQFGKWRLLLPDVNTPVTLLPLHAHHCGSKTRETWTRRRSDQSIELFRSQ